MKILVLSTNGARRDGITSWMIQSYAKLDRSGIESIDTVGFDDVPASVVAQLADAGLSLQILPSRPRRTLAYVFSLRRLVRRGGYDIVHINGNSGTVALELLATFGVAGRTRIVHSRNTQGKHDLLDKLLRPIMDRLCTDRVACGRDAGKWLFGEQSFSVIPNGREFDDYRFSQATRARLRQELGLLDSDLAVGQIGNLNAEKNHLFMLESFAAAYETRKSLRLYLVGEGALRTEIEDRVRELGLNEVVTLLGRSSRVPELLCAFDLAVLPSLYEGFPNVVIESQISGLPSIVSTTVTDECAVTSLVERLPISDHADWSRRLASAAHANREDASAVACVELEVAGYEAGEGARRLRELYARIAEREEIGLEA